LDIGTSSVPVVIFPTSGTCCNSSPAAGSLTLGECVRLLPVMVRRGLLHFRLPVLGESFFSSVIAYRNKPCY
jgi:hypothetical protein